MSLLTYDTGLLSYVTRVLSSDSIVAIGDGKFVIIANGIGGLDEFGYVVCQLDEEGIPAFGTPDDFSIFSAPRPVTYWDKSQNRLVIIYDEYPASKYLVCSVSGTVVSIESSGVISGIADDSYRAVCYSDVHNKAVLCTENRTPDDIRFYALSLSGGVVTATAAATIISGYPFPVDVKMTFCGEYGLVGFTTSLGYPASEVRVLLDVGGGSFDVSSGYAVPLTDHEDCLGLAGTSDGLFTGYWANGTGDIPFLLAGEIDSGGNLSFGATQLQYAESGWSGAYGSYMGMADGAGYGTGVFINRVSGDTIHMFVAKNDNLVPEVIDEQTSPIVFSFDNYQDVYVSVAFDPDTGFSLGAFFTDDGKVYVAPLFILLPQPIFWTNHTLQRERKEGGQLEKQATNKVIPGLLGQPYVPPTEAVPAKTVTSTGTNSLCKRVI